VNAVANGASADTNEQGISDKGVGDKNDKDDANSEVVDDAAMRSMEGLEGHGIMGMTGQEEVHNVGSTRGLYSLVNGLLYMTDGPPSSNLRLCIPSSCVDAVIDLVHSTAHLGIRKTFQSISTR